MTTRKSTIMRARGFTLIELLVTISVISILMGLLLPAVQSAREAARRTQCVNNLKQLGLAVHHYHDTHGVTPLMNDWRPTPVWGGWPFNAGIHVRLLPFLEQAALFESVDFDVRIYEAPNIPLLGAEMEFLHCPSDAAPRQTKMQAGDISPYYDEEFTMTFTNYVACVGSKYYYKGAAFDPDPPYQYCNGFWWEKNGGVAFADVRDGLSNTLMLSERSRARYPYDEQPWWGWWASGYGGDTGFVAMHPINAANRVQVLSTNNDYMQMFGSAGSLHPGGANFCFGDGSVRFLSETIESWDFTESDVADLWDSNTVSLQPKLYQWLSTRNGREPTGSL
jgi:prepilin-type N-terminal cleavage/methylation domain-containing protein/prepilin-type processing-associated H-X9-DG protein